jgi:hypothetical protein
LHERAVHSFLAIRRAHHIIVGVTIGGLATALIGAYEVSVPAAVQEGQENVPLWRMLALLPGVLPVSFLDSRLSDLEQTQTSRLRKHQRLWLSALALLCAVIFLALCAFALNPLALVMIARAWLGWFGLALFAGALLGWKSAWTLPVATAAILWYWGYRGDGRYEWWEFTARAYDDLPSLLLSVALFIGGVLAYCATPWRRKAVVGFTRLRVK